MLTLYWFALILGGGLALFSLLGDFMESGGAELSHMEHDADAGGDAHWHLLSMRTLTYLLFAFGAVGLLTRASGAAGMVSFAAAAFSGVAAALGAAAVFRYLSATNAGAMESDSVYEGLQARVVLPLRNGRGKIVVERAGREIEMMAQCYEGDATAPENWKDVVIVEIRGGTAYVSPMHELERGDAVFPRATEF